MTAQEAKKTAHDLLLRWAGRHGISAWAMADYSDLEQDAADAILTAHRAGEKADATKALQEKVAGTTATIQTQQVQMDALRDTVTKLRATLDLTEAELAKHVSGTKSAQK